MSPERLAEIQSKSSGVGIRGMQRLRQFNGHMSLESDGSGTLVLVMIPIPKSEAADGQGGEQTVQASI